MVTRAEVTKTLLDYFFELDRRISGWKVHSDPDGTIWLTPYVLERVFIVEFVTPPPKA